MSIERQIAPHIHENNPKRVAVINRREPQATLLHAVVAVPSQARRHSMHHHEHDTDHEEADVHRKGT